MFLFHLVLSYCRNVHTLYKNQEYFLRIVIKKFYNIQEGYLSFYFMYYFYEPRAQETSENGKYKGEMVRQGSGLVDHIR